MKKRRVILGLTLALMVTLVAAQERLAQNQVAASDAGMIIGVGFALSEKLNQLAAKYPGKSSSALITVPDHPLKWPRSRLRCVL
jgi:basic membrane lipoprotein Med (substrate-binding protein (PBP1-ABC) superfamily)